MPPKPGGLGPPGAGQVGRASEERDPEDTAVSLGPVGEERWWLSPVSCAVLGLGPVCWLRCPRWGQ